MSDSEEPKVVYLVIVGEPYGEGTYILFASLDEGRAVAWTQDYIRRHRRNGFKKLKQDSRGGWSSSGHLETITIEPQELG